MFQTAGVRSIRRVFSALSIVSLMALLGSCANSSPTDSGGVTSWTVENVASKSTAELYAEVIEPGVFERTSSKVIDGYTVESGNLRMPDKSEGSLVTVRSLDGNLTAFVERPGKTGMLVVKGNGESRFLPTLARDYSVADTVVAKEMTMPAVPKLTKTTDSYVIDMLIGYSRAAVDYIGGDALSNALVLVESVNLALRNSLVTNVLVNLVGVQVVDQDYWLTLKTLEDLPRIFSSGKDATDADMIYGAFIGHEGDDGPRAHLQDRYSMGYPDPIIFRHEVGHNAGGDHCANEGGGLVPYGYGHNNGRTNTILCGNEFPYYSNPALRDVFGLPRGDSATADMARVWRENANRLSSYAHFVPKSPTGFRVSTTSYGSISFTWDRNLRAVKYEIWGKDNLLLPAKKYGEFLTASGTIVNVPDGLRPYHLVAIYSDGVKSPNSNVVNAKPYER